MQTVTETSLKIWDTLSGSPVLRAATPSNTSSVAYPRAESVDSMDLDEHERDEAAQHGVACDCESVVDVFDEFGDFCVMCFERVRGCKSMIAPNGKKIQNYNPVLPLVVAADAVVWAPLLDSRGNEGHRFALSRGGAEQAKIEAFADAGGLTKIVVVHGTHTRLGHASGTTAKCSILKFATPQQHVAKLQAIVNDRTTMYLPVNEIVVGPALGRLSLACAQGFEAHALAPVALLAWNATKEALGAISDLTRTHIDAHNRTEFARVGLV